MFLAWTLTLNVSAQLKSNGVSRKVAAGMEQLVSRAADVVEMSQPVVKLPSANSI